MNTFTIEIPATVSVASRGKTVEVDTAKLTQEIVAQLVVHGLVQKVADAASGAKKLAEDEGGDAADIAVALMEKARQGLYDGEWTRRNAGEGVSEETRVQRMVVRNAVKAKLGGKSPEWKKFTGLADDAQAAKLDEWYVANEATFAPAVAEEMARRKAAAAAKAKLSKAVVFEL